MDGEEQTGDNSEEVPAPAAPVTDAPDSEQAAAPVEDAPDEAPAPPIDPREEELREMDGPGVEVAPSEATAADADD